MRQLVKAAAIVSGILAFSDIGFAQCKIVVVNMQEAITGSNEGKVKAASFDAKVKEWSPLLLPYGVTDWSLGGGGSDIGPLNTTLQTPLAGFVPDSQRYFDIHHARSDVFEAVNKRELELGAVNMAALIYLVDKYGL